MELWQIVLLAFLTLLPMALMLDFWPDRERVNARGVPVERDWHPQVTHAPRGDHH